MVSQPLLQRKLRAEAAEKSAAARTGSMRLKFGDCVLDLGARQLERANKVVPFEPKMYGCSRC